MKSIFPLLFLLILAGCNREPSLQKYFVEKTEDPNFLVMDLSPTMLNLSTDSLSPDQQNAVNSFKKVNILAFKRDVNNKEAYEKELGNVQNILESGKMQQLMKFGRGNQVASVNYLGTEEKIEEFVIYANADEAGFAVVRILGDNMSASDAFNLLSAIQHSKLDVSQLRPLQELMQQKR
jgi:hypothetical protein